MGVPGNVLAGSTLQPNQKARLGIKIPGDINWAGAGDSVVLCYSVGFNPGKGSVVDGTMWMAGYLCDSKASTPEWIDKQGFTITESNTLFCGGFGESSLGERWGQCDYVMLTLETHESVSHSGYIHVSFNLSTVRQNLTLPV